MSDSPANGLRAAAQAAFAPAYEAGGAFARAVREADERPEGMVATILAAEALEHAAEQAAKTLRAALAHAMQEAGVRSVTGRYHTASLQRRPAIVTVDEPASLPEEFLRLVPDKKAIAAAFKMGVDVPGASLFSPNEPLLVFRARKETPG